MPQIFTDPLALMSPGDPEQAAALIRRAASVSHDGVALDCAAYLGALQALAFEHRPLTELLGGGAAVSRAGISSAGCWTTCAASAAARPTGGRYGTWLDPRFGYGVFSRPVPRS